MRKSVSFMVNRKLAAGFSSWPAMIRSKPTDDPMGKAVRYFLNRNLARGWVCRHDLWEQKVRKLRSMRRSLGHFLNKQLSRGFGAWHCIEERRGHGDDAAVGEVHDQRKLAFGFTSWQISGSRQPRNRTEDPMGKALRHLIHRKRFRACKVRCSRAARGVLDDAQGLSLWSTASRALPS